MRKYASPRFEKTLALARNFVNITFPPEFGVPVLIKTPDGMAAMFPDNVSMRSLLNGRYIMIHPVGEGHDATSAVINLFETYASRDDYEDILVAKQGADMVFGACETPYATVMFQKLHRTVGQAAAH